jgi:hypothetical protein
MKKKSEVEKPEKKEETKKDKEGQELVAHDDELYTKKELRNQIVEDAFGDSL